MNSRSIRKGVICFWGVTILGSVLYWLVAERQRMTDENRIAQQNRIANWITEQKQGLASGETNYVHFYSTVDTDNIIAEFSQMPEIEGVGVEMCDLSNVGFRHVAELPRLKRLMLYGGDPRVGDLGFELLRGNQSLQKIELINVDVTDTGLSVLETLPNLTELVLFRERFRDVTLTDAALVHLCKLTSLEKLTLSGGWMSQAAISSLRVSLPNCVIEVDANANGIVDTDEISHSLDDNRF